MCIRLIEQSAPYVDFFSYTVRRFSVCIYIIYNRLTKPLSVHSLTSLMNDQRKNDENIRN